MATRADRIFEILNNNGRLKVSKLHELLCKEEGVGSLNVSTISATVRSDNQSRDARGQSVRFNYSGDGTEERGYISILRRKEIEILPELVASIEVKNKTEINADNGKPSPDLSWHESYASISDSIEKANNEARRILREEISSLTSGQTHDFYI